MNSNTQSRLRKRKGATSKKRPALLFGAKSTICLLMFALIYGTFLICFQPMLLDQKDDGGVSLRDSLKKVHKPHVREGIKHAKERLMEKERDFVDKIKHRHDHDHQPPPPPPPHQNKITNSFSNEVKRDSQSLIDGIAVDDSKDTGGFMLLGMHRSGTSMLAGLLVEGFGYNPGEPLIQPAYDNEKGFYELIPAVLQNDILMGKQHVDWSANVKNYDASRALTDYQEGHVQTIRGSKALLFFNNESSRPWLQKDPRMCITMRTWLPLLNTKPAVIFTYRHPLEVAMSLAKRQNFKLAYGLRLWMQYNKAAVLNSADLCRVLSSNNAILADPLSETKRIANELTTKCNVPSPPRTIDQVVVESFVDTSLQHNRNKLKEKEADEKVLAQHGDCIVKDFESKELEGSPQYERDMDLYLKAMKLYCDFESGEAYKAAYEWPEV